MSGQFRSAAVSLAFGYRKDVTNSTRRFDLMLQSTRQTKGDSSLNSVGCNGPSGDHSFGL